MRRFSVVLLVAVAMAGCKKQEQPAAQAGGQGPAATPGADAGAAISGKVLEKLDAPPYSYLKIQSAKGEVWAAVPKSDVAVGAEVSVGAAMPMEKFESKTLNRTFELVYFGTLGGDAPAAATGAPGGMAGGMPPGMGNQPVDPSQMAAQHAGISKAPPPADIGDVKVPKASGADARTIAEVFAQKGSLKEKPVTIRGKVVKYNAGIMGKNWVHLRDGSGTAGKDNDITITTSDVTSVGEVVVVKGTVRVDKDFGSGYAYPVIVEDATITK